MGHFMPDEQRARIETLMFDGLGDSLPERLLRTELGRYVEEFGQNDPDDAIRNFAQYQQEVYVGGKTPELGRIIACLNPTFIAKPQAIQLSHHGQRVWTTASVKENGFRMQLHVGPHEGFTHPNITAVTRQFTPYDLRLFPELHNTLEQLPVMIGDAELINRQHTHLAGFNRIQARLPGATYWPRKGSKGVEDALLEQYFSQATMFVDGNPKSDFEVTLSFHSLFAIADPETWNESREAQLASLESLSHLPKDYRRVSQLLDRLEEYLTDHALNARVVERQRIRDKSTLLAYVRRAESDKLEGVCVAQHLEGDETGLFARTIKIKNYETVDAVVLGVYLRENETELQEDTLAGALLGLYDPTLGRYVPAFKVNLDSEGRQIKNDDQRTRLDTLRAELMELLSSRISLEGSLVKLKDVYLEHGQRILSDALGGRIAGFDVDTFFDSLPRGQDLLKLYDTYKKEKADFDSGQKGTKKSSGKTESFIYEHRELFSSLYRFEEQDSTKFGIIKKYFDRWSDVKDKSAALPKPTLLVSTDEPIVLEAKVFDLKYNTCSYAIGFDPERGESLHITNCFAERVRRDKKSTTDLGTIAQIAAMYSV
ncbi:hypothetical protein HYV86_00985 [Candidatus Woesearchaeota archaeon]|nr:hypothetical protein [Candidatus Woesearchaeota archaeon]